MEPLKVSGLDLSPTGTGLVTLSMTDPKSPPKLENILLLNRGRADGKIDDAHLRGMGIENLLYVASGIGAELGRQKPSLVVVEDYSGGGTQNAFILACTGEVTGAAKLWMKQLAIPWLEVAGSTLKKFVSGSGAGKKEVVWLGCYKRWGVDQSVLGDDNNVLDAYCLARLGLAITLHKAGKYDPTKYESEVFKVIRQGGAPRPSKKKKRASWHET